jgi:hypothetical protein
MKSYFTIVTILIFLSSNVDGKIRNGYESQIQDARLSLKSLDSLVKENLNLSGVQRRQINSAIRSVIIYITYYELTEKLIEQFRIISLELFNEIDTIKDHKGRPVDTFIKFLPRYQAKIDRPGTTIFAQGLNDSDAHHSEYGSGSISVKIWALDNALFILSHEFGHIKYIAPNLASYAQYYKTNYHCGDTKTNYIGHRGNDVSGKTASVFEKKFYNDYRNHIRNGAERFRLSTALKKAAWLARNQHRKAYTQQAINHASLTPSFHSGI